MLLPIFISPQQCANVQPLLQLDIESNSTHLSGMFMRSATPNWISRNATPDKNGQVVGWLFAMAALVAIMVVIGGVTRLTGSGLSMVEWRPLMGTLPPLTADEWNRVYGLYRASPEYQQINHGMSLAEFKMIFFWEYFHRLWGRLLGIAFALPLIGFMVTGCIPQGFGMRLTCLFALGGLQGLIGWWMEIGRAHV